MLAYLTCFLAAAASAAAPCRRVALSDVLSYSVHDGDVPRKAATFLPRDQCNRLVSCRPCGPAHLVILRLGISARLRCLVVNIN